MNRLWFGGSGLVLSLLVVTFVWAAEDPKPPKNPGPKEAFFGMQLPLLTPKMQEQLKLSDEQKEKVDALLKEFHAHQKEAMAKHHDAMEKLAKDMNPSDAGKIGKLSQEFFISARKHHAEAESKLKGLLTEDQKKKYEDLKKGQPNFPPFTGPQPPFPPFAGPGMMRPYPGHILPPFMEGMLKLSKEQKEKIAKVEKEAEAKVLEVLNDEQKKQVETMKKNFEKMFPTPPVPPKESKP